MPQLSEGGCAIRFLIINTSCRLGHGKFDTSTLMGYEKAGCLASGILDFCRASKCVVCSRPCSERSEGLVSCFHTDIG